MVENNYYTIVTLKEIFYYYILVITFLPPLSPYGPSFI